MSELLITWPALTEGKLIRRYQRFKADVRLASGQIITVHCPNSGSMRGCLEAGRRVYLTQSSNPKRKYAYTLEIIEMPLSLVVVNTLMANRIVKEAIGHGHISELSSYSTIRGEVAYGQNSRIDLLLEGNNQIPCLVEIKSCTLVKEGVAMFPDAVTKRGLKHLIELKREIRSGKRCVMLFLVQRMDGFSFRPAEDIDPSYARELRRAWSQGVEILVYSTRITLEGITVSGKIPFDVS